MMFRELPDIYVHAVYVELASTSTRFSMSRYLMAGETPAPAPTPEAEAWLEPDPTTFDWYAGEWALLRIRSNVLLYLHDYVGIRGYGDEPGHFVGYGTFKPSITVEEYCKQQNNRGLNFRRGIHQGLWVGACKPGDAVIVLQHEAGGAGNLYRYEFRIRSRDDNASPGQVTGIAVAEEAEQLRVSWNQVAEATGYKVQWKSGGLDYNESSRQHLVGNGAATEHTITGLTADVEYTVRVIATKNNAADGPASAEATGTPTTSAPSVPPPPQSTIADAPENLQAVAGNAEVTLTWNAPGNDGGADITGYQYRQKESGASFSAYADIPESGPGEANARSYAVTGLTNGLEYVFRVRAVNRHGRGAPGEATVMLPSRVRMESEELPSEVALSGNYPNPFNPETTIRYALPQAGNACLAVYDLLGHEVAVLVDEPKPAGHHAARFDAGDLPSGAYVYRLQAQGKVVTNMMMLVK